jgi:hypothetical protein
MATTKNAELKRIAYKTGVDFLNAQLRLLNAVMAYGLQSKRIDSYKQKSKIAQEEMKIAFKNFRDSENERIRKKTLRIEEMKEFERRVLGLEGPKK